MQKRSIAEFLVSLKTKATFTVTDVNDLVYPENKWVANPSPSYLEFEIAGPLRIEDIQWVDIDPVVTVKPGRLMDEKRIDHSEDIINRLKKAGISYSVIEEKIRVRFR